MKLRAFIIFPLIAILFIFGCNREKVEAPPSGGSAEIKVAKAPPAPQQQPEPDKEMREKVAEAPPPQANNLPEISSIKLNPKVVYPGTKIKAEVEASDKDDDAVSFYYEWKKNGRILSGIASNELNTTGFKKGDLITLYVTPFDGKEKGKTKWSTTIMIANRAPQISSIPPSTISNGKYIYEVKAADPDGDMLTFTLEDAPQGMTIEPATGVISWNIPAVEDSKSISGYNIRIIVTDGDAKAFQVFSLSPQIEIK